MPETVKIIQQQKYTLLWSVFVLFTCLIPGKEIPQAPFITIPHFDKIVHFSFYFILSLLFLQSSKKPLSSLYYFADILYCFVLGIVIEFIQHHYIPNREGDIFDVFANFTGSIFGLFVFALKFKNNKR